MDWNIDRKLSTITVDNCSTNYAMLNYMLDKLPQRDMLLDGKVLHMRCCAHILNLIVKEGLEIIGSAIEKIRDSVIFWTASPARIENFDYVARQLHINCSKKLSLDCKTRWNSTYLMLETAIIYKDVFPRLKHREKHYKNMPTDEDWDNAIEICQKLKLFFEVTEMFSGTLYPTSNFYFPKICLVKIRMEEWAQNQNPVIKRLAENMLEKYRKCWSDCHIIMGVAAVLDPRYKMKLVEFYFPTIFGEESKSKIDEISQNCYNLLRDYQTRGSSMESSSTMLGGSSSFVVGATSASSNEIGSLEEYDIYVASTTTNMSLSSEFDFYLEEPVLPRTPSFDVLSWWKTNGVKFPYLQRMARDILAIPVSTVASECAFSTSGRLLNPHHSRLNPSTLEALMCSRHWLWNDMKRASAMLGGLETCPTMLDEEEDGEECVEI